MRKLSKVAVVGILTMASLAVKAAMAPPIPVEMSPLTFRVSHKVDFDRFNDGTLTLDKVTWKRVTARFGVDTNHILEGVPSSSFNPETELGHVIYTFAKIDFDNYTEPKRKKADDISARHIRWMNKAIAGTYFGSEDYYYHYLQVTCYGIDRRHNRLYCDFQNRRGEWLTDYLRLSMPRKVKSTRTLLPYPI